MPASLAGSIPVVILLIACSAPLTPPARPTRVISPTPTALPPLLPLGLSLAWRFPALETLWDLVSADLDGDQRPEVVAASQDKGVYALNADGGLRWRFAARAGVYALAVGDLNGDRDDEIIAGSDDNFVYALDDGGRPLWSYETGSRVVQVAVEDRPSDGTAWVVASSWDGDLYLLDGGGDLVSRIALGAAAASLELKDLDGNDTLEILAGTEDGRLVAWDVEGTKLWERNIPGSLRLLDVGPAGRILAGSSHGVLQTLLPSGAPLWSSSLTILAEARWGEAGEVFACCVFPAAELPPQLVRLSPHGSPTLWSHEAEATIWALRLVDVEGDGELEIVTADDAGWIKVLDELGRTRGRYRTHARPHALASIDLDGDGLPEIVASSGSEVYALRVVSAEEGETGVSPPEAIPTLERATPEMLPPAPEGTVELLAVGDIFFCRSIEERMDLFGVDYPLAATAELTRAADISIGNLECPLTIRGAPINKRFIFRGHPRLGAALSGAGMDLVSLANNHILDFGLPALEDTLANLESQGIPYVGAGPTQGEAQRPVVLEANRLRFAFLAYAAIRWSGSEEVPTQTLVSFAEVPRIRREVARAKQEADFVIVLMHLGTEYQATPDAEQIAVARAAIESGASLVIGHHPHVTQEPESYAGGLIVYSLGNFVFDIDITDRARDGAILRALFDARGLVRAEWIPVRIVDDVQPRLVLGEDARPLVLQVYP